MVERNLAKVEVESSRLFSRSRFKIKKGKVPILSLFLVSTTGSYWRDSKAVMHRIANPCRSVRLRLAPPDTLLEIQAATAKKSQPHRVGFFVFCAPQTIAHYGCCPSFCPANPVGHHPGRTLLADALTRRPSPESSQSGAQAAWHMSVGRKIQHQPRNRWAPVCQHGDQAAVV